MTEQEKLYVALVNVPKEMTTTDTTSIFIEIRAQVYGFDKDGNAVTITRINELCMYDAVSVNWMRFWDVINQVVKDHFAQFKEAKEEVLV